MEVTRKQSTLNFPKNEHFLLPDTDTYVCRTTDELFSQKSSIIYIWQGQKYTSETRVCRYSKIARSLKVNKTPK